MQERVELSFLGSVLMAWILANGLAIVLAAPVGRTCGASSRLRASLGDGRPLAAALHGCVEIARAADGGEKVGARRGR